MIGVAVASFLGMLVLGMLAGDTTGEMSGANPNSESAIGYRGLVTFLGELELPVMVNMNPSFYDRLDGSAFEILLEPPTPSDLGTMRLRFAGTGPVLVVLPKWRAQADPQKRRWIGQSEPLPADHVRMVMEALADNAEIIRPQSLGALESVYDASPSLARPQLVKADGLSPLISSDQGVLLGWLNMAGEAVYVLSDPDVLNNHGIDNGDNARLAAEMIDDMRDGRTVVLDATLHGFTRSHTLWRILLEPPLLPVTLLGLGACAVLFWSAATRFGAPAAPPPRLARGKRGLIDNTAALLGFGGHLTVILDRYRTAALRQVASTLHAPGGLDIVDLQLWLDRVAEARGLDARVADLAPERTTGGPLGEGHALLAAAHRIYRWKTEMLRGSVGY
jgi:hypothetical protein